MNVFSGNIRYLRAQRNLSQKKVAEDLIITRGRYAKYEDGASEPPLDILRRISYYYHVSIDLLVSVDIRKVPFAELLKLEDNRILLPITVNTFGDSFIEIIPHRARAGYLTGYSDPEFIENLQHISLPFLKNGKFRAFPIIGDSMPPHNDGSFVVGRYLESLSEIKNGHTYILLTLNEGIVYKRVYLKDGVVELHSDNELYQPYEVHASEILEIWEFACSLSTQEADKNDLVPDNIKDTLAALRKEVRTIKEALGSSKQ